MHECDDNDIEIPSFWSVIENDSHKLWNIRTYMLNEIIAKLSKVHHNSENLKPLVFFSFFSRRKNKIRAGVVFALSIWKSIWKCGCD